MNRPDDMTPTRTSHLQPCSRRLRLTDLVPQTVYRELANRGNDFLFETHRQHPSIADAWLPELSIVGLPCSERIDLTESSLKIVRDGDVAEVIHDRDPLGALQRYLRRYVVAKDPWLPVFPGGLFGFFGFETARIIEPRLARAPRNASPVDLPDGVQLVTRDLVVFDHRDASVWAITHHGPGTKDEREARRRLDMLCDRLGELALLPDEPPLASTASVASPDEGRRIFDRASFHAAVERIKAYIVSGDVMQVVLSQDTVLSLDADALTYYRALSQVSPAPYNYLLNLGTAQIIGASPEALVRHRRGRMVERPMAGTRPRGATAEDDRRLEAELLADPKENAEHMMLVDLARNDLGRLARPGSVHVDTLRVVERYSHVMHMVSTVSADVDATCDGIDSLRATLPAGTLSGASKVRALEIINELEPSTRGVYGGTVGYITWHGDADLAIAIRTAVLQAGDLHIQTGAGVVLDSDPEREWQETLAKGRALMLAADIANRSHCPCT